MQLFRLQHPPLPTPENPAEPVIVMNIILDSVHCVRSIGYKNTSRYVVDDVRKFLILQGFESRPSVVHPVGSRYTGWAILISPQLWNGRKAGL
jgi:hypothetical protein